MKSIKVIGPDRAYVFVTGGIALLNSGASRVYLLKNSADYTLYVEFA
jgi:hypothetical protein